MRTRQKKNDVKLKVVVDEYNDGKKIFDYYSDRNFIDYNNKTKADTDMDVISKNNQKGVENLLDAIDTSSDKVGLVKKVLLNKDISDGVKAKAVNRLTKNKISQGAKIVIFSLQHFCKAIKSNMGIKIIL